MEGPRKCKGCQCTWYDDICFDGDNVICAQPGGCLTSAWAFLDDEYDMPRPRQGVAL